MTIWQQLLQRELIDPADRHLADYLLELDDNAPECLGPLAALASAQIRAGNVCLPLVENALLASLGLSPDEKALRESSLVACPGERGKPLILDDGRLYLARYHVWEREVLDVVQRLLTAETPQIDEALLKEKLDEQFRDQAIEGINWQRVAIAAAVTRRFCIITGGPGTGKTWTLARILEQLRAQPGGDALRIALAAPTGKAAARMTEAIRDANADLLDALDEARTLHRLLGMRPGRVRPRHGADNPLPFDLVIVDEVSMVDLPMMARLMAALPENARLILLGDRFQLASVEAGQVMADLCGDGGENYSPDFAARMEALTGDALPAAKNPLPAMADHLVMLRHSRRFDPNRGIGALARAVNEGDIDGTLNTLARGGEEIAWRSADPATLTRLLRERVVPLFEEIRDTGDPAEALQKLGRLRVLCALREGPQGVANLNALIERALGADGRGLYHGQPIMVSVNDYAQQLFNGDIGLVLHDAEGRLRVWFPDGEKGVRPILPARLPAHETVYAMTIHKSQGSEFNEVILVLPEQESPVVTRELFYTGITRARENVTVCASEAALEAAIARRTQRISGLYRALWGG